MGAERDEYLQLLISCTFQPATLVPSTPTLRQIQTVSWHLHPAVVELRVVRRYRLHRDEVLSGLLDSELVGKSRATLTINSVGIPVPRLIDYSITRIAPVSLCASSTPDNNLVPRASPHAAASTIVSTTVSTIVSTTVSTIVSTRATPTAATPMTRAVVVVSITPIAVGVNS